MTSQAAFPSVRLIGLAVALFALTTGPAAAAGAVPASVDRLLELSGLTEQYSDMAEDMSRAMAQQREFFGMLSDEDFSYLTDRVITIVDPDVIISGIKEEIQQSLSEEDLQKLLTWYTSDLGQKITEAEVAASTQAAHRQMMALKQLQLTKTDRVAYARRFDELLQLSTFALEYNKLQQQAMVVALNEILGAESAIDPVQFRRNLDMHDQDILEEAKEMIAVSIVFTYRWLSDEELEEYFRFNSQEHSLKLSRAVFQGALSTMRALLKQMPEQTAVRE